MVSYIEKLWWGCDPNAGDPLSGLSKRDIKAIQNSWAPVYAKAESYGMALFLSQTTMIPKIYVSIVPSFFNADPETKTYFNTIRDLNDEEIKQNVQFRAHVINLMSHLNMAILNLDRPEVVVAMMVKLGRSHNRFNIKEHHFHTLKSVLVEFLQKDRKASPALLKSWSRFIDFIYPNIFSTLQGS